MPSSLDLPATPATLATGRPPSFGAAVMLALDLGTTTGWALSAADGTIVSGTMSFRPSRYEGGGMRYLRFRSWLNEVANRVGEIGTVHFEEVRRHVSTDSSHVYGGFLATLSAWCEVQKIAYQGVPVGTIKRFISGKGNACLLYTSPSPRDRTRSRMPSSA